MTQYTGPSWNDMARLCSTGGTMELRPVGGGQTLKVTVTSTQNHFAGGQQFLVQCRLNGKPLQFAGIAPSSNATAIYRLTS